MSLPTTVTPGDALAALVSDPRVVKFLAVSQSKLQTSRADIDIFLQALLNGVISGYSDSVHEAAACVCAILGALDVDGLHLLGYDASTRGWPAPALSALVSAAERVALWFRARFSPAPAAVAAYFVNAFKYALSQTQPSKPSGVLSSVSSFEESASPSPGVSLSEQHMAAFMHAASASADARPQARIAQPPSTPERKYRGKRSSTIQFVMGDDPSRSVDSHDAGVAIITRLPAEPARIEPRERWVVVAHGPGIQQASAPASTAASTATAASTSTRPVSSIPQHRQSQSVSDFDASGERFGGTSYNIKYEDDLDVAWAKERSGKTTRTGKPSAAGKDDGDSDDDSAANVDWSQFADTRILDSIPREQPMKEDFESIEVARSPLPIAKARSSSKAMFPAIPVSATVRSRSPVAPSPPLNATARTNSPSISRSSSKLQSFSRTSAKQES